VLASSVCWMATEKAGWVSPAMVLLPPWRSIYANVNTESSQQSNASSPSNV
jgi:hypothetical protein